MPLEHEGIRQVDMDRVAQIIRLRAVNAKLLAALEEIEGYVAGLAVAPKQTRTQLGQRFVDIARTAHAVIEEAKK